ncbi:DUF2075 domain-containing protein [Acinetobacter radioresistens]|nr:DUF2075 domain-containing protein [Acinetobacter radioresistens]EJO34321.1 PF09848 family protein [Acinetobacter radioresistens WC-A-157]
MGLAQSYYQNNFLEFRNENEEAILGSLAYQHEFSLDELQKSAWLKQITILKRALCILDQGEIFFEFHIPRMGKRVDNILIIQDLILVIEFKVGDTQYSHSAQIQVIDYCLDLLNFHAGSHNQKVIPVLVATQAAETRQNWEEIASLNEAACCNAENFGEILSEIIQQFSHNSVINTQSWLEAPYKPTPTIIEAAQALYKGHQVQEISRSDAGMINLEITSNKIEEIIEYSKQNKIKSICFLTGVPGAGKTLAGLNIANQRLKKDQTEHAVFLSGNGPLVDVLREALVRDTVKNFKLQGLSKSRLAAERSAKAFVQNIHHFRDYYLRSTEIPVEQVVVFDEAQRAWQKEQVSNFMKLKKGIDNFTMSEPEFLINVMNRHIDWCVVVCLIGGGQEINTGEAGVTEWLEALKQKFSDWQIYYSEKILEDSVYLDSTEHRNWLQTTGINEQDLHLAVSVRSFRSERVSQLIQYILDGNSQAAQQLYSEISSDYPVVLSRNLKQAKQWLKTRAKGSERYGIVASSGAKRLRADGIDIKSKITPEHWFLNLDTDVRSSYYLEEVATEFDIQGLEIDYTCVAWDINFYFDQEWKYQAFKGSTWQKIKNEAKQKYLLNAYRVLLTRARQGMVIYVPEIEQADCTRPAKYYNFTYQFLMECGFETLK